MRLNLPEHEFVVKPSGNGDSVIFDRLRGRFVALTPEEWVRQNFVEFLIGHRGFPGGLMGCEVSLTQNGISRRCDILVTDRHGEPLLIVECKAPGVKITQPVFDQIWRYNSVLRARYLVVTNGLSHYCCRMGDDGEGYTFLRDIPRYEEL